jgi:hypothetical protein
MKSISIKKINTQMQNRYTLPLLSALVVAASLASCQRKAEEATAPAEEIVFTPGSPSRTKAAAAAGSSSSVKTPVKASSGEEFSLVMSSCPWMVEEPSTPATKVTPSDASYFSTSHNSFGVLTYSAPSEGAAASSRTLLWKDEAVYNGVAWAPSTSRAWPFAGYYLTFFCWAPYDAVTASDNSRVPVILDFTVAPDAADQVDLLVSGKVESTDSPLVSGIRVPVTFGHALTAVKFAVGEKLTINSVSIRGIYDKGSYNMETGKWSGETLSQTYSLDESSMLMLIPQALPAGATLTAETSAGTITASLAGQVWEAGKTVTYQLTAKDLVFPFSVSATQKVRFSPGNLQAVFDEPGTTFTWQFAEHQWSYVGNSAANTSINGDGSVSEAGTVDLFGWSTAATKYGINNSSGGIYTGEFVDWGSDEGLIAALGSGWRTLSSDEWAYLLYARIGYCYCKATVNDVRGLVIFPDGYSHQSHPAGVTAPASVNTPGAGYGTNSWSGTAWAAMEAAGCVFLPAAGQRFIAEFRSSGQGFYQSSTKINANTTAYSMNFAAVFSPAVPTNRFWGLSVRLVQDL